jgi:hypothetical protein
MALITESGCATRVRIDDSGSGQLRWTTPGAGARFARVEVRRPGRGPLAPMVALTNPVWLPSATD